ncbi:MAG: hypothetical protein R3B72_02270 [Polyangiaceae bacterium]
MDLPIVVYILPPIVLAMVVFSIVARRRGLAQTQHATVGALAQRLGLHVQAGDPSTNLYYLSQPSGDFERRIRLAGAPRGRRIDWAFADGQSTQDFLLVAFSTHRFGCYLGVEVGVPFADFEITLRQPPQYLEPSPMLAHLPEVRSGDPAVDAAYLVRAGDMRLAPALVPAIHALRGRGYVHIVGQQGRLMLPITRYGLPYFVHDAEAYVQILEIFACLFEGRPLPAPPPPVAPMA